jgi:hypothetical protein
MEAPKLPLRLFVPLGMGLLFELIAVEAIRTSLD